MGDKKECYRFENHVYDDEWCSLNTILENGNQADPFGYLCDKLFLTGEAKSKMLPR